MQVVLVCLASQHSALPCCGAAGAGLALTRAGSLTYTVQLCHELDLLQIDDDACQKYCHT